MSRKDKQTTRALENRLASLQLRFGAIQAMAAPLERYTALEDLREDMDTVVMTKKGHFGKSLLGGGLVLGGLSVVLLSIVTGGVAPVLAIAAGGCALKGSDLLVDGIEDRFMPKKFRSFAEQHEALCENITRLQDNILKTEMTALSQAPGFRSLLARDSRVTKAFADAAVNRALQPPKDDGPKQTPPSSPGFEI